VGLLLYSEVNEIERGRRIFRHSLAAQLLPDPLHLIEWDRCGVAGDDAAAVHRNAEDSRIDLKSRGGLTLALRLLLTNCDTLVHALGFHFADFSMRRSRSTCMFARNGTSGCVPIFTIVGRSSLTSASRWSGGS
jgi:hypothetical protein